MADHEIRVGVTGRIGDHTARMLGGRVVQDTDGFELVVPYLDQAQVTGLLMRLDDLHIGFRRVTVAPTNPSPDHQDPDTHEGARP